MRLSHLVLAAGAVLLWVDHGQRVERAARRVWRRIRSQAAPDPLWSMWRAGW